MESVASASRADLEVEADPPHPSGFSHPLQANAYKCGRFAHCAAKSCLQAQTPHKPRLCADDTERRAVPSGRRAAQGQRRGLVEAELHTGAGGVDVRGYSSITIAICCSPQVDIGRMPSLPMATSESNVFRTTEAYDVRL